MRKIFNKKAMFGVLGVLLITGTAASAATKNVEGGTWTYNVNSSSTIYSNYYHPDKIHGSSVTNGNGVTVTDYNKAAGKTSHASTVPVKNKVNSANYCVGAK